MLCIALFAKGRARQTSIVLYMMTDLRITLVQDRPDKPFRSGSSVTGNLLVNVDEPKSYERISIQFLGRAYVYWTERVTEGSGDDRRTRTVDYTSSEVYIDVEQTLWTAHVKCIQ